MNNADKTAMPTESRKVFTGNDLSGNSVYELRAYSNGLTKREHFAGLAMQGILANKQYNPPRRAKAELMADDAVFFADALLAALEDKPQ